MRRTCQKHRENRDRQVRNRENMERDVLETQKNRKRHSKEGQGKRKY